MNTVNNKIQKSIEAELKSLRCTAALSPEARQVMASIAVKRKYTQQEAIWEIGDSGEYAAIITSGLVEIARFSGNNDEMTMGIFGQCDVIGISALVKKCTYPGNATSITKSCEVLKLYLRPVLSAQNAISHEIQIWVREMMLLHEQVLRDKIDILHAGNVEQRVCELLRHLARRFGVRETNARYLIPLRITRTQAAKLINVRVETMIRMVGKLQRKKLIRWTQKGILIESLTELEKAAMDTKD